MRFITYLILLLLLFECQPRKELSPVIGSWRNCLRNGGYREFRIDVNHTLMTTTEFEEGIAIFNTKIENNTIIFSGDNVIYRADTLMIIANSDSTIILKNTRNEIELTKLKTEISIIDSLNLIQWKNRILEEFQQRYLLAKCPDLRTKEEKNRVIEIGVVEDDFDDINDIPYDPELDSIVE